VVNILGIRHYAYWVMSLLLAIMPFSANAETIPASNGSDYAAVAVWYSDGWGYLPGGSANPQDICDALYERDYINNPNVDSIAAEIISEGAYAGRYQCIWYDRNVGGSGAFWSTRRLTTHLGCPSGGTLSGSTCVSVRTCPENQGWSLSGDECVRADCAADEYRQSDGSCASSRQCVSGDTSSAMFWSGRWAVSDTGVDGGGGSNGGVLLPMCDGSCVGMAFEVTGCWHSGAASPTIPRPIYCQVTLELTGAQCSNQSINGNPGDPPSYCPTGQHVIGYANGNPVCGTESDPELDSNPPTPNPSVDTPATPAQTESIEKSDEKNKTTEEAQDGTKTESSSDRNKTTTCVGSKCTTTETVNRDDGTSTTTTKEQSKSDFCKENPKSNLCGGDSSYADGSCGGTAPKCTGDAVQCAQAVEIWKLQCALTTEPDDDAYKLGKAVIAGNDPGASVDPLNPANITEIDVRDVVSQAAGQRTLSASCIASPNLNLLGRNYTLDMEYVCKFGELLGYMMVAAASIIAIRMISA
jgi:hypothetical protein